MKKKLLGVLGLMILGLVMLPSITNAAGYIYRFDLAFDESVFTNAVLGKNVRTLANLRITDEDANYGIANTYTRQCESSTCLYGDAKQIENDYLVLGNQAYFLVELFAKPYGNKLENPDYDFDKDHLENIEVWINGTLRNDVSVGTYNEYWRHVFIYIPVTITEYVAPKFTVTFDTDGGSSIESIQVFENGYVIEPTKPTKSGKKFVGWYKDAELTDQFNFSYDKITKDTTLYAKYRDEVVTQNIEKIELSLTEDKFDNSMTGNDAISILNAKADDLANYGVQNIYIRQCEELNNCGYGNAIQINGKKLIANRTAYAMLEVYAKPFQTNMINPEFDFDQNHLEDIEIWFNGVKRNDAFISSYNEYWRIVRVVFEITVKEYEGETYNISFDGNGGSGTMTNLTGVTGNYTLPENEFTAPAGKKFKGWSLTKDGSTVKEINVSENKTVYAIWTDITYSLTAISGGHGGAAATKYSAVEGDEIELKPVPSTGYRFKEYQTTDVTIVDNKFIMPANDVVIKFVYELIPVVKTKLPKPTIVGDSELTYNGNLLSPTINGNNDLYMTATGSLSERELGLYAVTFDIFDKENYEWEDNTNDPVILLWSIINEYKVSFDANGGTGTMLDSYGYNSHLILPTCGFTAPVGKKFNGWSLTRDGKIITDVFMDKSVTVYAIWVDESFNKVKISQPKLKEVTLLYTGSLITPIILNSNEELFDISGTLSGIEEGSYFINFEIKDKGKYEWEDGMNYDVGLQWFIVKPVYSLEFDSNGGIGYMSREVVKQGYYVLPSNKFEAPAGKKFKGWSLSTNGPIVTSIEMLENKKIYAIWENVVITSIKLNRKDFTGRYGQTYKTVATVSPIGASKTVTWKSSNTKVATVDKNGNIKIVSTTGYAYITATSVNNKTAKIKVTATKAHATNFKVSNIANQVYNGKVKKPTIKVTYNGKTLKLNTDYTIEYKNNKVPGKAFIIIKAKANSKYYTGSKTVYFYIVPKKVTLNNPSTTSKTITVKWVKDAYASGYEIYVFAKDRSDGKILNASNKVTSLNVKNLLKNKYYEIQVRSYKTIGGIKYFGPLSSVKTIKCK